MCSKTRFRINQDQDPIRFFYLFTLNDLLNLRTCKLDKFQSSVGTEEQGMLLLAKRIDQHKFEIRKEVSQIHDLCIF